MKHYDPAGVLRAGPFLALCLVLAGMNVFAQCSIYLGPDHVICQGQNVNLTAPAGFNNYLWNTGSNAQGINVNASGNYSVQVSYPTGELAVNGNFEGGAAGFTTHFTYSANLQTDGHYMIGTNAAAYHPQFTGVGNGNFLMINSGWWHAGALAWCQSIPVCPGQTYQLRFRGVSLANNGFPSLQWNVNGQPTFVNHQTLGPNNWQTFTTLWTAPAGVTQADFCIEITSGHGVGNDLGLDDISISSTIVLTDNVIVTVNPLPVVDLGADATLCAGESLMLDAAVPGGTYLWQNGSNAPTFQVTGPGSYNVTVTANNCSSTDQINVTYLPLPQVDLGPNQTICAGETVTFDVSTPNATYEWHDGSTGPTFTAGTTANVTSTVTVNGCSSTDAVNVTVLPLPVVDLGPDRTICAGQETIFDATTPGGTYLWHDGSTGPSFTATAAGTVSVTVTVNGCTANDAANVTVNPLPVVALGADQVVCPGTPVTFNVTVPGSTYLWSDGSTQGTHTTTAPGTYWVRVTRNGCIASDTVTVSHHELPVVDLGGTAALCAGGTTTIGTNIPNSTYLWNTGATTGTIEASAPGTYWLNVTRNGCLVSDTVIIHEVPLPVVDLGPAPMVCAGASATLDATTAGGTYLWSTGATTPTIAAPAGTHEVAVTVNGCTGSGSIIVGQHPDMALDLGDDAILCPGEQLVLEVQIPSGSVIWNNGSTTPTLTVTDAGTYSVDVTDQHGCTASDAITITLATPTAVELGPDVTICQGDELTLDATLPGATYLWSTGATTPTISVGTAGTYSVIVGQGNCSVSDQITISVDQAPVVFLGIDTTLCPDATLALSVNEPGGSYLWNNGSTAPSITVDQAGTWSVTVTNAAGCSTMGSIQVAYASPTAVDLGGDLVLCDGENVTLSAQLPGSTHLWSTGATTDQITVSTSDTYWVRVFQGACEISDTVSIEFQPVPVIALGTDQVLCAGEATELDASWPGATYSWSTGATTPAITVSQSGTYTVTASLNECQSTGQVTITVLDGLALDLGPDAELCAGGSITLAAPAPGALHTWSTGATTEDITVTSTGTYWVQVSQSGCMISDTISVIFHPAPLVDLGQDQVLCTGGSAELDATFPGATYSWSTGATTPAITVSQTGSYSVTATLGICSTTDQLTITVLDELALDLGPDAEICLGDEKILDATTPGASYAWSTGATTSTLSVGTTGTYWVNVAHGDCIVSDTIHVQVNIPPVADLGGQATICEGSTITFDVDQADATYLWDDGSIGATRSVQHPGTYWVQVRRNDCMKSDTVLVALFDPATVDLGPDVSLCPGSSLLLSNPVPGAASIWSNGADTQTITITEAGIYWLLADLQDCNASDTIEVTMIPLEPLDLGDDLAMCAGDSLLLDAGVATGTISWSTGATTPSIMVHDAGIYMVSVELDGCTTNDQIAITILDPITTLEVGSIRTICPDEELVLDVSLPLADTYYSWSTGDLGPVITVNATGVYTVHASGACVDASGTITVLPGDCGAMVHIPNSFTPNDDGRNDVFHAYFDTEVAGYRMEIFDRWGASIFTTNDPYGGWDGSMNGREAQSGVYIWKITYRTDGVSGRQERMGHVTLLR